ncbi:MAG: hypothetical protein C5B50_12580 [Verrucomicrobia bacterium]|nr:MAG: hypothetical protein C5B50_12580 [Verrucomicrobiota bacterium]
MVWPCRPGALTRRLLRRSDPMGTKALFGLTVLPAAMLGCIVLASISRRVRDLFFVLLFFASAVIERQDVNFVSREWYRGSSRGFEVSIAALLAVGVLFGSLFGRVVSRSRKSAEDSINRLKAGVQTEEGEVAADEIRPRSRFYMPASFGLMLLFFLYAGLNVAISDPQIFGEFELFKMIWGIIVFLAAAFYVRGERELRLFVIGLAIAVAYEGALAVTQRYWWHIHRIYGTMDESNSLSMFFCTTAPVFVAAFNSKFPKLLKALCALALALAVVAEVLTISRAGVVTMAVVILATAIATMSFQVTGKSVAIALVAILAATGVTIKSWKTLSTRFGESTLKAEYTQKRSQGRGYYLRIAALIGEDTFTGVGLNNWSYWVSNKYGPKLGYRFTPYKGTDKMPSNKVAEGANLDDPQAAPAHNLGALTLGELGIPGLVLFSLLWLRWFQMGASFLWPRSPDPLRRLAIGILFGLCGLFLQSLTEWAFRHLPIYFTSHALLGTLAALYRLRKQSKRQMMRVQVEEAVMMRAQVVAT